MQSGMIANMIVFAHAAFCPALFFGKKNQNMVVK
jgi:hypothetical protein